MTERINTMIDLKIAIEKCEEEIKNDELCEKVKNRYFSYLINFEKLFDVFDFDDSYQALFDEYLKRHTSFNEYVKRIQIIKWLD